MIAARSLADDRLERDVVQVVDLPERFASSGIREVDLDERSLDGEQCVAQRDARVGQAAGVDDGDLEVPGVEPVDEHPLMVGLEERDLEAEVRGPRGDAIVETVAKA